MRNLIVLFLLIFAASEANAINVTLSANAEGGDKPVIVGKTNLPDGTDLMISIKRASSSYSGQSKVKVSNGAFRTGPFTQKGAAFNPGTYELKVTTPYAQVQPKAVQAQIGERGEKLQGVLTKKGSTSRQVEYKTTFKVDGVVSAEKDKSARAQDKKDTQEWIIKSCKDICTAAQLQSGSIKNFDWERCYNKCMAEQKR